MIHDSTQLLIHGTSRGCITKNDILGNGIATTILFMVSFFLTFLLFHKDILLYNYIIF